MEDLIKKLLEEVSHDMDGLAKTPAKCHLFNINDRAKKLSEENTQLVHQFMAKLLCRRTQQDKHTTKAFLCIRVKCPDEDYYKKLVR